MVHEVTPENFQKNGEELVKKDVSVPNLKKTSTLNLGKSLSLEEITPGLSNLRKNLQNQKFAFTKLVVERKHIEDISILSSFIHLRTLILSKNRISNLSSIAHLEYLEILDVSHNFLESPQDIPMLKYLKHLDLSHNNLKTAAGFLPNYITHLNLQGNQLTSAEGLTSYIFPNLIQLEIRENNLSSLDLMQLPRLENLFAAKNNLNNLAGLVKCPMLQILHLRGNRIAGLKDFPSLVNLKYVNLRGNRISKFTEANYLIHSPNIQSLILKGNPIAKSSRYRAEMTILLSQLKRLDKAIVKSLELEQGKEILRRRMRGEMPPLLNDPTVGTPPMTASGLSDGDIFAFEQVPPNSAVLIPKMDRLVV